MLALPYFACAESGKCTDDVQISITHSENHPKNEKEDCGAFCTCSCCVHIVSISYQSPKIVIDKPLQENKIQFFYNNISLPSNHFGNIWQPPKSV